MRENMPRFEAILFISYFTVSILIEILDLIFYFTPNKEDDKLIAQIKKLWYKYRTYVFLLNVRQPIKLLLTLIYTLVIILKELIKYLYNKYKNH